MSIIKCKMCGGDLNILEDSSVCECEYCGTKQTVPKVDDEKKLKLFARAGKLLRNCEFDKAAGVFESILADFPEEAEAYWGLILCKYGIEYVDDPATGKKVPTCHRSSFDSVEDDPNFEQACENADAIARRVYREEARQIETLRKRILEVSGKEEPYDVFIAYKELDEDGERTPDSVIAQDIYRTLTKEGYRVFFSRISLEGKLGVEYEPYIFAALNSAKVMIVVGTDYEYYDAVWVKNEWSRFLKLIASGQQKTLIPVYKDMDPYDMPKELRSLAAQNMGKIGAMQDLMHGIEKLLGKQQAETAREPLPAAVQGGGPNVIALLKRGDMALEDGEWEKARGFFDQVLSMDAENARAFLGLALAANHSSDTSSYIQHAVSGQAQINSLAVPRDQAHINAMVERLSIPKYFPKREIAELYAFDVKYHSAVRSQTDLADRARKAFQEDRNMLRAFRFADSDLKATLESMKTDLFTRLDEKVKKAEAAALLARKDAEASYRQKMEEADENAKEIHSCALDRAEKDYQAACKLMSKAQDISEYEKAQEAFFSVGPYKDAPKRAEDCADAVHRLKREAEEKKKKERAERERERAEREEAARKRAEKDLNEKIAKYEAKIYELEKELKHPTSLKSIVQKSSMAHDLEWYRSALKELKKQGETNHE